MFNLCSASCNNIRDQYGFPGKHPIKERKGYLTIAFLEVAPLVFGLLGLLKVGPFAHMSPVTAYSLTGIGAFFVLTDSIYVIKKWCELKPWIDGRFKGNQQLAKAFEFKFEWLKFRYTINGVPVACQNEISAMRKKLTESNYAFYAFNSPDHTINKVFVYSKCDANQGKKEASSRRLSATNMADDVAFEPLDIDVFNKVKGFSFIIP